MTRANSERAIALLDAALAILKDRGEWHEIASSMKIRLAVVDNLKIAYRTPFQRLPDEPAGSQHVRAARGVEGSLPYAVDVWSEDKKVMLVEWDDHKVNVATYRKGDWESAMTAIAKPSRRQV